MTIIILRNEVDEVLRRIARQKQDQIGGTFQQCYDETLADYHNGAISDGLVNFVLTHPDAQIVLGFGDTEG